MTNPHLGSSLDDFLQEDGLLEQATALAIKRVIAWQLQQAMTEQKLTKTAMALAMGTTRSQLDRLLHPNDGNVTLLTLQRAAEVVGKSVRLELVALPQPTPQPTPRPHPNP